MFNNLPSLDGVTLPERHSGLSFECGERVCKPGIFLQLTGTVVRILSRAHRQYRIKWDGASEPETVSGDHLQKV